MKTSARLQETKDYLQEIIEIFVQDDISKQTEAFDTWISQKNHNRTNSTQTIQNPPRSSRNYDPESVNQEKYRLWCEKKDRERYEAEIKRLVLENKERERKAAQEEKKEMILQKQEQVFNEWKKNKLNQEKLKRDQETIKLERQKLEKELRKLKGEEAFRKWKRKPKKQVDEEEGYLEHDADFIVEI